MQERILIVDDDEMLAEALATYLRARGFQTLAANSGREGLKLAEQKRPDLILLDIMLPEMDGWLVCRRLRETSRVPVIFITAKTTEQDVLMGFHVGGDDYLTKPFSLVELEERCRAIFRRMQVSPSREGRVYDDGTLRIDLDQQQVWHRNIPVRLTPTEFRLLEALLADKGRVMPHAELLVKVWGAPYAEAKTALSLYIRYLREKLEDDPARPAYIQTQWGVGYWFAPQAVM